MSSPHSTDHPRADEGTPSYRVVEAVANEEGAPAHALDRPLNDVVDPDALDALFDADGVVGAVEFTYHGYRIVVDSAGRVTAEDDAR